MTVLRPLIEAPSDRFFSAPPQHGPPAPAPCAWPHAGPRPGQRRPMAGAQHDSGKADHRLLRRFRVSLSLRVQDEDKNYSDA